MPRPDQIIAEPMLVNEQGPGAEMGFGEDIIVEVVEDQPGEAGEEFGEIDGEIVALMEELTGGNQIPFNANLAEHMDEDTMLQLSDDLSDAYDIDLRSRSEWEETYKNGLELLGLKIEDRTEPWDGAFGAYHPLLTEAVVKFQSETIIETFPAQGPAKTKILGTMTPEKELAAARVREDMNHMLTDTMTEYRPEHEKLLWSLPISGSAFKKVYFDPTKQRAVTQFVPAEDFIVSYGATDLPSAERYTHRMKKSENEIRKLQEVGFYRKMPIADAVPEGNELEDEKDEHTGLDANEDSRPILLEMHCDIDLPGFESPDGIELPYVVTIERATGDIYAIYRNYEETDQLRQKRIHFSHYTYIPGFGFYGFGLIHLIGGFTKGATSIMRQLVDAGTLSNLPGGFRTRGFRIKGGDAPVAPGEFRETDVATGTLKENIMPLPFKEPSIVLFELLKSIVDEGRRFAAVSDVNIADMQPNAPVGSTLAILERTLKTMTAIQARVHFAMKFELGILKTIAAAAAPAEYDYDALGQTGRGARKTDYNIVEIIPVSDPNASSMSQRVAQYQAALQLMQMNPGIYDEPRLHRNMLETLGIKDVMQLVPDKSEVPPGDPVTENMNILNGAPVKAYQHQDHKAHLAVHTAFAQDPQIQSMVQQQGPGGNAKMMAMAAHVNEHVAFAYRQKIEQALGQPLPPPEQPLPPEIENQLSQATAGAAQQLLQQSQQEVQAQQQQQEEQDPLNIIQRAELDLQKREQDRKDRKDEKDYKVKQADLVVRAAGAEQADQLEQDKLTVKVMEITGGQKLQDQQQQVQATLDTNRTVQAETASRRQADTSNRQTAANERNAQRQAASAAKAAQNQPAKKPQEKKDD